MRASQNDLISFCDALKIFCCLFYDIALAVVIRTVWVFITDFAVDIKRYFLYRIADRLSRIIRKSAIRETRKIILNFKQYNVP